jgi:type IV pilus assembly protein PilA
MLRALVKRFDEDEEGFTLIELMVVVLIIAILIAIAIPTFIGARGRAQERAAQSNLRNAYAAAKTVYTDSQQWSSIDPDAVQAAEPTLELAATGAFYDTSTGAKRISIAVNETTGDDWMVMAVEAETGDCFLLAEVVSGMTTFGVATSGTYYAKGGGATCSAAADPAATEAGWLERWGATPPAAG